MASSADSRATIDPSASLPTIVSLAPLPAVSPMTEPAATTSSLPGNTTPLMGTTMTGAAIYSNPLVASVPGFAAPSGYSPYAPYSMSGYPMPFNLMLGFSPRSTPTASPSADPSAASSQHVYHPGCRHSGNQGTTSRPAKAHYDSKETSLRIWCSTSGEALVPEEIAREALSRGGPPQWVGAESLSPPQGAFPLQGGSVSRQKRIWALCPPQSHGRTVLDDAGVVVAISMYKAVSKARPRKGTTRIATLMLGGAPAAADASDVTNGALF